MSREILNIFKSYSCIVFHSKDLCNKYLVDLSSELVERSMVKRFGIYNNIPNKKLPRSLFLLPDATKICGVKIEEFIFDSSNTDSKIIIVTKNLDHFGLTAFHVK